MNQIRRATFTFTTAKPRKDGDYPVVVTLVTFDGKVATCNGKVTIRNVAPQIKKIQPAAREAVSRGLEDEHEINLDSPQGSQSEEPMQEGLPLERPLNRRNDEVPREN